MNDECELCYSITGVDYYDNGFVQGYICVTCAKACEFGPGYEEENI